MADFDIAVIGAGPGGFEAALRARELGFKVGLVEKSAPGGACLNTGCIPTKSLLASSRLLSKIKQAESFGIQAPSPTACFESMVQRKNRIVETLRKAMTETLQRSGIEWIVGRASFVGTHCLNVQTVQKTYEIEARYVVIATGSEPVSLPNVSFEGDKILSSDQVLEIKEVPQRLAIIGGGAVGVEFASMFEPLGTKVTIVEMLDRLIAHEDEEVSRRLDNVFRRKGIEVYTGERVKNLRVKSSGIEIQLLAKKLEVDKVLVAVGRKPRLEDLSLHKAGIKLERNTIWVDDFLQTSAPGVYAIGDVTNRTTGLAHGASAEGVLVVENLKGPDTLKMDYRLVPSCIYTDPEVASVGLARPAFTKKKGYETVEAKVLFASLGKPQAEGETEGFLKMIASKNDGKILGVTAIGARVTELIHEAALAIRAGLDIHALAGMVHAHPTESEILQKAAQKIRNQMEK